MAGVSAIDLNRLLQEGDPVIVPRAHHAEEGWLNLDAIEMTDDEIRQTCDRVRRILADNRPGR